MIVTETTLLLSVAAYALGSIVMAVPVCWLFRLPDPRTVGSKNPGASNVLRLAGKRVAVWVLLGDFLKGLLPVLAAKTLELSTTGTAVVLLAAVLGHVLPIFFRFQGGKGVATALGGFIALSWWAGLSFIAVWLLMLWGFRFASLASLSALLVTVGALCFFNGLAGWPLLIIAGVIIWRHRTNIQRLFSGTEAKIGAQKGASHEQ